MSGITAIVLAGGPADDLAALQPGAPNKAFVEIAGKTLAQRAIEGLRSSAEIGRIIVVAPVSAHAHPALAGADECRPDGERITESLRNGLAGLPPDDLVIVAASDLPILTEVAVTDFVRRGLAADPDIGYGCLEKQKHLDAYPDLPHTWAPLKGGTYCGGGMIVIKPRALPELERFIEKLGAARKNPLALAGIFGWDVLLKFAIRQLTLEAAEARASQLLGMKARAIVSPFAETAVNVDRVSDVALAEALIETRAISLPPDRLAVLDYYRGIYDVAFVALHPFESQAGGASLTWRRVLDELQLKSLTEVAVAIMTGAQISTESGDPLGSKRLDEYCNARDLWFPAEDTFPRQLIGAFAQLCDDLGISTIIFREQHDETPIVVPVSRLLSGPIPTNIRALVDGASDDPKLYSRPDRMSVPDHSLFAFVEFDRHYTIIATSRSRIGDIALADRFEGFAITAKVTTDWWYRGGSAE